MAILLIVLLLFAYKALVIDKEAKRDRTYVGETSVKITELNNKAKLTKFLIEKGSEMIYYKSLENLASQGGGCEEWSRCKPASKIKFSEIFEKDFNEYANSLIPGLKYNILEKDNKLKFESNGSLDFFSPGKAGISVGYYVKHNFEIDFDYEFDVYGLYHDKFHEYVENCDQLNLPKENKCYIKDKLINVEIPTKDLMFVRPVIKFKLGLLKPITIRE